MVGHAKCVSYTYDMDFTTQRHDIEMPWTRSLLELANIVFIVKFALTEIELLESCSQMLPQYRYNLFMMVHYSRVTMVSRHWENLRSDVIVPSFAVGL